MEDLPELRTDRTFRKKTSSAQGGIELKVYMFERDAVDWLWWPTPSKGKGDGDESSRVLIIVEQADTKYPSCSMAFQDHVFFDVGRELKIQNIKTTFLELLERDKNQASMILQGSSRNTSFLRSLCFGAKAITFMKHSFSAEIILTSEPTQEKLKYLVYPWCEVKICDPQEDPVGKFDFSIRKFEVSEPDKNYDREVLERALAKLEIDLGSSAQDIYVGFQRRSDMRNIYFPTDAGRKGHVGIVVVPSKEVYQAYRETNSVKNIPRRVSVSGLYGEKPTLGFVPISLEDPVRLEERLNLTRRSGGGD